MAKAYKFVASVTFIAILIVILVRRPTANVPSSDVSSLREFPLSDKVRSSGIGRDSVPPLTMPDDIDLVISRIESARIRLAGESLHQYLLGAGLQAIEQLPIEHAEKVVASLSRDSVYEDLSWELGGKLAKEDPMEGLRWLGALQGYEWNSGIANAMGNEADPSNLLEAIEKFSGELRPEDKELLQGKAFGKMGAEDLKGALIGIRQTDSLSDDMVRQSANMALGHAVAAGNVQTALDNLPLAESLLGSDASLSVIAGTWASWKPAGMAEWISENPHAPLAVSGVSTLVGRWSSTDAESASAWLATLPISPMRDQGVIALARSLISTNPEDALIWLNEVKADSPAKEIVRRAAENRLSSIR